MTKRKKPRNTYAKEQRAIEHLSARAHHASWPGARIVLNREDAAAIQTLVDGFTSMRAKLFRLWLKEKKP